MSTSNYSLQGLKLVHEEFLNLLVQTSNSENILIFCSKLWHPDDNLNMKPEERNE